MRIVRVLCEVHVRVLSRLFRTLSTPRDAQGSRCLSAVLLLVVFREASTYDIRTVRPAPRQAGRDRGTLIAAEPCEMEIRFYEDPDGICRSSTSRTKILRACL